MADFISTITGKVKTRTPQQAEALSSRYVFLNLQNAEPNLGIPSAPGIKEEYVGDPGYRYALLSNNTQGPSAWRVWAYENPKIATFSKEGSIALGNNPNPINNNSIVYSNYTYDVNNVYNSQSFADNTFNVFSVSGIYLFDATTIGDPASATAFIVAEDGKVGINTETPNEVLTVVGNISATGGINTDGNSVLGNTKGDFNTIRGTVRIADSFASPLVFGSNNTSYDTNLYRLKANTLHTDDTLSCDGLSGRNALSGANVVLTNANIITPATTTDSGQFLILNINGANKAIRLWDYTV